MESPAYLDLVDFVNVGSGSGSSIKSIVSGTASRTA
jgi:hypothetical protein